MLLPICRPVAQDFSPVCTGLNLSYTPELQRRGMICQQLYLQLMICMSYIREKQQQVVHLIAYICLSPIYIYRVHNAKIPTYGVCISKPSRHCHHAKVSSQTKPGTGWIKRSWLPRSTLVHRAEFGKTHSSNPLLRWKDRGVLLGTYPTFAVP